MKQAVAKQQEVHMGLLVRGLRVCTKSELGRGWAAGRVLESAGKTQLAAGVQLPLELLFL